MRNKEKTPRQTSSATPLKEGNVTVFLESKIGLMVYKLYDLTYKEIKIVDAELV